jgi:transcriptional regulator with XRE-family HTH domain
MKWDHPLRLKLVRRRRHLGMTQYDLAAAMSTVQSQISALENGHVIPRIETLDAWTTALEMDLIVDADPWPDSQLAPPFKAAESPAVDWDGTAEDMKEFMK